MNYITDVFLDRATIKKFQNMFSTSLNLPSQLMYLYPSCRYSPPKTMCSFSICFLVAPLPLSIRRQKFSGNFVFPLQFILQKQPQEVFCKKGVLKTFANFTGKHLCSSPFLIDCCFFNKKSN